MEIAVESAQPIAHTLALRLPEWCSAPEATLNGEPVIASRARAICTFTARGGREIASNYRCRSKYAAYTVIRYFAIWRARWLSSVAL
ncbi:hypothetical protein [Bradyrhizobium neotropicale]|uniref:hypothetical protein n=1 Tax=Bradyrhizobium neotropicale TaxID=1497615 RepID=UPI00390830BF